MVDVAEHPVFRKLDPPRGQEPFDAFVLLAALDAGNPPRRRIRLRIDEDQRLAALYDELVDGIERLVGEPDRLDDHQEIDVLGYFFEVRHQRLDLEHLLDLLQNLPFRQHLALLGLTAGNRQRAHEADHVLLRMRQGVDHLGQVVFQEPLALERDEGHQRLVVGAVGGVDAEIDIDPVIAERHALKAGRHGAVLGVGERFGIEHVELHLAAGDVPILLKEGADPLEIALEGRRPLAERGGEIEPDLDRFVDRFEHLAGAVGQRIEALVGEIERRPAQARLGQDVDRQEDQRGHDEAAQGQMFSTEVGEKTHVPYSAFFRLMTTAFTNSQKQISET